MSILQMIKLRLQGEVTVSVTPEHLGSLTSVAALSVHAPRPGLLCRGAWAPVAAAVHPNPGSELQGACDS